MALPFDDYRLVRSVMRTGIGLSQSDPGRQDGKL
jgi:hypothetical protein